MCVTPEICLRLENATSQHWINNNRLPLPFPINSHLRSRCVPGTVLARYGEMCKSRIFPSRLMEELKVSHDMPTMWVSVLFTSLSTSISSAALAIGSLELQEILRHSFAPNAPGLDRPSGPQRGESTPNVGHPAGLYFLLLSQATDQ